MRLAAAALVLCLGTVPSLALECHYESAVGDQATYIDGGGRWELQVRWADYEAGNRNMPIPAETCSLTTAGTGMTQVLAVCPNTGNQLLGFRALSTSKAPDVMGFYGLVWFGTCGNK